MKKFSKTFIFAVLISLDVLSLNAQQSVPIGNKTPRYKIHGTATTKTIVINGGVGYMGPFSEGMACVSGENGWFVINKQGEKLFDFPERYIPAQVDNGIVANKYPVKFRNGRLMIKYPKSLSVCDVAIMDNKGQIVKSFPKVHSASPFSSDGGVATIEVDGRIGWVAWHIDRNGNILSKNLPADKPILQSFRSVYRINDGRRSFYDPQNKTWGYCDEKCNIVIPAKYKDSGDFHNGLAQAKDMNGQWGYIDTSGKYVIGPMYSKTPGAFYTKYAKVLDKENTQYFINQKGEIVFKEPNPGTKDILSEFWENGYAVWWLDRKAYIVDSSFQKVAQCELNSIGRCLAYGDDWFVWGCPECSEGYKLYDLQGNVLIEYDSRAVFSEGMCSQKNFYFNDKGEIIVKFEDTQF